MAVSFKQYKKKVLKHKAVRREYDALALEHDVVRTIIKYRLQKGWSQTDLAKAIGSRQPVISRLERGEGNPSLQTLQRIANALDVRLHVSMK